MTDHQQEAPIIIKKIKRVKKAGHHGGSWKIAYADFVTAMMAFFLIMWILSMLNKSQLKSVSEYFKDPQKTGLVSKGTRVNKDKEQDYFLEKGNQHSQWKDKNKDVDKKKEDFKVKVEEQNVKKPSTLLHGTQKNDLQNLLNMKHELEQKLNTDPQLSQFKNHLNFIVTANGLKIIIKDLDKQPMFSTGKTDFIKYAGPLLSWLGNEINQYPNKVEIIGHTDTLQYANGQYTNWELSADRANATRRLLVKYGVNKDKIIRVIGYADHDLLNPKNGQDASNRRIDIIVLTDEAVKKMLK